MLSGLPGSDTSQQLPGLVNSPTPGHACGINHKYLAGKVPDLQCADTPGHQLQHVTHSPANIVRDKSLHLAGYVPQPAVEPGELVNIGGDTSQPLAGYVPYPPLKAGDPQHDDEQGGDGESSEHHNGNVPNRSLVPNPLPKHFDLQGGVCVVDSFHQVTHGDVGYLAYLEGYDELIFGSGFFAFTCLEKPQEQQHVDNIFKQAAVSISELDTFGIFLLVYNVVIGSVLI